MEYLEGLLSPELLAALVALCVAVKGLLVAACTLTGALTGVVAALKLLVPPLQRWADRTETNSDNAAVGLFATLLSVAATMLDRARSWLELAAGNRFPGEQVVKVLKVPR